MRELIVNGVPLRDPLGEWSIDYTRSKMLGDVARTISSDPEYGFHGHPAAADEEAYFDTSQLTWVLNIMSPDRATHALNLRAFQSLFGAQLLNVVGAPQSTPLAGNARGGATFNLAQDLQAEATMRMIGSLAEERINDSTSRLTAIVENLSAFWASVLDYTTPAAVLTFDHQGIVLDAVLAGSSAPVTRGMVRIKGPVSAGGTVTVRDTYAPFRSIRYTATSALTSGQYVVIDMATLAASLNSTNVWTFNGTDVSSRVTTGGDGAFYLAPVTGATFPASWSYGVTVDSVGYTAGSTTVEVRARKAFFA